MMQQIARGLNIDVQQYNDTCVFRDKLELPSELKFSNAVTTDVSLTLCLFPAHCYQGADNSD